MESFTIWVSLAALADPLQLAVLMGKIARVDWPRVWPELFPSLANSLISGDDARRRMALCGTDEVRFAMHQS